MSNSVISHLDRVYEYMMFVKHMIMERGVSLYLHCKTYDTYLSSPRWFTLQSTAYMSM